VNEIARRPLPFPTRGGYHAGPGIEQPESKGGNLMKARRVFAALAVAAAVVSWITPAGAASAAGAAKLQAYFAKDFTDTAYQQSAFKKVASSWKLPAKAPAIGQKTVVIATVTRDGKVADTRLNMKSGEPAWDESALAAVKQASPFAPFPSKYPNASTEVHFHFEWSAAPAKP
jgi:TonB family protein